MDTKKLRQKILDLAIHGKLVPQDPNDEPASVLLERIRAEKERLIKEGKIKRSKKSASDDEIEAPFEIPESWEWVRLDDIAESNIGLTYKPTNISNEGVPVYRSNNILNRLICKDDIVRVNTQILDKQYLHEGDLLICARNGSRNLVGKCALIPKLTEPTSFGAFMAVCRSHYNKWIFLMLNSEYFNTYLDDSNSTTINQVTQKMLLSFRLPFPPVNEQERIYDTVCKYFTLIDELESNEGDLLKAIDKVKSKILDLAIHGKLVPQDPNDEPASALLEHIRAKKGKIKRSKKSASDDEIEAPFEIPESWEWVRLDALCDIKGGKRIPHGMTFSKVPTEHVYLRVTNMKCHTIIENEIKYIDEEVFQIIKNYTISSDDLYLTIAGTIGDVGEIPLKFSNMNLTENAAKLTNLLCDKQFLMYALLSTSVQNHFSSKFHQVAQPKLSIETASSAIIALPPLAEQKRIVAKIEEVFNEIDKLKK